MVGIERSPLHLDLIIEMIGKIQKHLQHLDETRFLEDGDAIDLLAFRLSQIGESVGKLSPDILERNPQIPWKAAMGMRHLIVHEYRRVAPVRLWETASNDLLPLLEVCRRELEGLGG
jgi:uncharacterized protein with HEPN domain